MLSAGSNEKLSATGSGSVASRMKNLFYNAPITRRKRAMSLDALSNPIPNPVPERSTLMFGAPLNDLIARDHSPIPFLVRKIVRYIEEHGLSQVGIYRINGNAKFMDKLRESFDTVGDAHFSPEDIASIAGLLKLFLRELPDGIIPDILMPHFVTVQQTYSSEATPEALKALQRCLRYLPKVNFNMLRYLMRHLVKVAECSDVNKMTTVSLSIVFGPSVFHCGAGLEGLKLQGYSNATVCRMIQHYRELFIKETRTSSNVPEKPCPYSEHIAEKQRNQEEIRQDLSTTYDPTASPLHRRDPMAVSDDSFSHRRESIATMDTSPLRRNGPIGVVDISSPHRRDSSTAIDPCNLDQTHLEGRVNGPTQEMSQRWISLGSHSHFLHGLDNKVGESSHSLYRKPDGASKSSSSLHCPAQAHKPLLIKPHCNDNLEQDRREEDEMTEDEARAVFQRRNAMRFKPRDAMRRTRSSPLYVSQHEEAMMKQSQVTTLASELQSSEESLLRNYSPCSWKSSPCSSPATSPSLIPRRATMVNATVGATVRDLLFQPNIDRDKVVKNGVYGLLLPETKAIRRGIGCPRHPKLTRVSMRRSLPDNESYLSTKATNNVPIVMRTNKSHRGQMNRKTSLQMDISMDTASPVISPINDINAHRLCVNHMHQWTPKVDVIHQTVDINRGVATPNVGRVCDLVKQFDYNHTIEEKEVMEEVREEVREEIRGERDGRKKQLHRTIEKLKKSNSIKRTANPKSKATAIAMANSSVPLSTARTSGPNTDFTDDSRAGLLITGKSEAVDKSRPPFSAFILGSNTSDEEVLASPDHSPHSVTVVRHVCKGRLSTASDDVFVSPRHIRSDNNLTNTSPRNQRWRDIENRSLDVASEFDCIKPNYRLKHLTLSRPKGPQSRKKPHRFSTLVPEAIKENSPLVNDSPVLHAKERHFSVPASKQDEEDGVFSPPHKKSPPPHYFYPVPTYLTFPCPNRTSPEDRNQDKAAEKEEANEKNSVKVSPKLASGSVKSQIHNLSAPSTPTSFSKHSLYSTMTRSSTGPSPSSQHKDKLSWLDLVTLAPERKQAVNGVRKGWADAGVGVVGGGAAGDAEAGGDDGARKDKVKGSALSTRELSHRVHDLKNSIREFEADFFGQHGRRPSNHEKSSIRTRLIELARLKKLFKERKESEEKLSQAAPAKINVRGDDLLCRISGNPASTTNLPAEGSTLSSTGKAAQSKIESMSKEENTSGTTPSSMPVIEQILMKIMRDVEACRNKSGRPNDLDVMTNAQLQEEKHSIQKLLLDFEKHYGRPQNRSDKAVMRPLYDRYRVLKRKCGNNNGTGHSDSQTLEPEAVPQSLSEANLEDALPTITLLQPDHMQDVCEPSKSGVGLSEDGGGQPVQTGTHGEDRLKECSAGKGEMVSQKKGCDVSNFLLDSCDLSSTAMDPKDSLPDSSNEPSHLLSERELQICSHADLKAQKTLLLARKSELRRVLSEYEINFRAQYGRKITKQDKKPVDLEYSKYKIIKGKLRLIEAFLTRPEPQ